MDRAHRGHPLSTNDPQELGRNIEGIQKEHHLAGDGFIAALSSQPNCRV
jgi:hypothetical protein